MAYILALALPLLQRWGDPGSWKMYIVYVVVFAAVLFVQTIFSNRTNLLLFVDMLLVCSTVMALIGIGIYFRFGPALDIGMVFQPQETFFPDRLRPRRARGIYVSPSAYGGWLLLTVFFAIARGISSAGNQKLRYIIMSAIILFGIILTNARGVVGALIIGLLVYITIHFLTGTRHEHIWTFTKGAIVVLPSAYLLYLTDLLPGFNVIDRFIGIRQGDHLASISTRVKIWQDGIDIFLSNPLFGVGLNRFGEHVSVGTRFAANPHNIIIQWLAETGLVSTLLACAAILISIRTAVAIILTQVDSFEYHYSIAIIAATGALFAENMVGSSLRYASPFFLFWVLLASTRTLQSSNGDFPT
jgi:O-antigen ligase